MTQRISLCCHQNIKRAADQKVMTNVIMLHYITAKRILHYFAKNVHGRPSITFQMSKEMFDYLLAEV
jgi:hypothetical protein